MGQLINILQEIQIKSTPKWYFFNIGDRVTFDIDQGNFHWVKGQIKHINYIDKEGRGGLRKEDPKISMISFAIHLDKSEPILKFLPNPIYLYYEIIPKNERDIKDNQIFNTLQKIKTT